MRKVVALLLVVVFVLAFSSVAFATSTNMNNGFESSPVFENRGTDWYAHESGTPRFGTATGNIAIGATQAGENSADESIVEYRDTELGEYSLVQTGTVGNK